MGQEIRWQGEQHFTVDLHMPQLRNLEPPRKEITWSAERAQFQVQGVKLRDGLEQIGRQSPRAGHKGIPHDQFLQLRQLDQQFLRQIGVGQREALELGGVQQQAIGQKG